MEVYLGIMKGSFLLPVIQNDLHFLLFKSVLSMAVCIVAHDSPAALLRKSWTLMPSPYARSSLFSAGIQLSEPDSEPLI